MSSSSDATSLTCDCCHARKTKQITSLNMHERVCVCNAFMCCYFTRMESRAWERGRERERGGERGWEREREGEMVCPRKHTQHKGSSDLIESKYLANDSCPITRAIRRCLKCYRRTLLVCLRVKRLSVTPHTVKHNSFFFPFGFWFCVTFGVWFDCAHHHRKWFPFLTFSARPFYRNSTDARIAPQNMRCSSHGFCLCQHHTAKGKRAPLGLICSHGCVPCLPGSECTRSICCKKQ